MADSQTSARDATAPGKDVQLLGALTQLADYLSRSGSHTEAVQEYERAQHVASGVPSRDWVKRIHRGQARSLTALGRHDEAIEHLASASDDADDQYALVMMILRVVEELLADQQTSEEDRHRSGSGHIRRVESILGWQRLFGQAAWTPAMIGAVRRGYTQALAELASVASDVGDHASAMALFERHLASATEDAPEWAAALEQLGHEYVAMGDRCQAPGTDGAFHEARSYYEMAREIFEARASVVGLRTVLRRCATIALALDDMEAFERLETNA